jgi:2-oxoglutarate ferredoxin oxidoreductase subunit beta
MDTIAPKSWKMSSKPHLFCPGCGHGIVLKQLGFVIDELGIQKETALGIDIGCSLLSWDCFDVDTIQTHHGRTTSTMVGYKKVKPKRIAIAYMGDGGGYAIGLQALIHSAYRNEPVTVILVNNENYAMTGGQASPTTPVGMVTATSPSGKKAEFGTGFHGPELLKEIASKDAYIARASIVNPINVKSVIQKAIENQTKNKAFSFVEILAFCPTNWKTNAKDSLAKLKEMEELYPLGEFKKEIK